MSTNNYLADGALQFQVHDDDNQSDSSDHNVVRPLNASEECQHTFVHPDAVRLFRVLPCAARLPIFGECSRAYGPKCTTALGMCYFLSKGLASNILSYAQLAMFTQRYALDATRYQRLAGISKMGWSIKSLSALLSDCFALFGYTKRWYCAASCVLGGAVCIAYGLLPAKPSSADIAAAFVFLSAFGMANVDILSEGHYSRMMRRVPESGALLVSVSWWFITFSGIVAAAIQGPISDIKLPQVGVFIAAGAQIVTVIFFIFNWYEESTNRVERVQDARMIHDDLLKLQASASSKPSECEVSHKNAHPEEDSSDAHETQQADERGAYLQDEISEAHNVALPPGTLTVVLEEDYPEPDIRTYLCGAVEFNRDVCLRNWRVLTYSIYITCCIIAMACITILGTRWALLYTSIAVFVTCVLMNLWALPLVIAKACIYFYLHLLLYLQIPGALDTFYTASSDCLPDGPHFTYTFYSTIGKIIGNVAGVIGVTAFPYFFAKHSYRFTFNMTTFVQILASIFDIVIVKRWNVTVGIPDHAMYILGDSIIYEVSYMFAWMPLMMLVSRVCPRGSESMVFALGAGFGNTGQSMSNTIGSLIMELGLPIKSTVPCDFSNVPLLVLIGHILMPLLIIPISFFMLPRARICDDIDIDGHVIQKEAKRRNKEKEVSRDDNEPTA